MYISRSLKFIIDNNDNNINDEYPCIYIYYFLQKNGAEIKRKVKEMGKGQKADFRWINSKRESGSRSLYRRSRSEEKCDDT